MCWRVTVLIAMAVLLGAGALICIVQSSELSSAGQRIFENAGQNGPTAAQEKAAGQALYVSSALHLLGTPLALASVLALVGVAAVLAVRWHRRELATESRP